MLKRRHFIVGMVALLSGSAAIGGTMSRTMSPSKQRLRALHDDLMKIPHYQRHHGNADYLRRLDAYRAAQADDQRLNGPPPVLPPSTFKGHRP